VAYNDALASSFQAGTDNFTTWTNDRRTGAAGGATCSLLDPGQDVLGAPGLRDEGGGNPQVAGLIARIAGCQEDAYPGPGDADDPRQLEAPDRTGRADIREDDADLVPAIVQNGERAVSASMTVKPVSSSSVAARNRSSGWSSTTRITGFRPVCTESFIGQDTLQGLNGGRRNRFNAFRGDGPEPRRHRASCDPCTIEKLFLCPE
jgi:hypothetical protein